MEEGGIGIYSNSIKSEWKRIIDIFPLLSWTPSIIYYQNLYTIFNIDYVNATLLNTQTILWNV